MADTQQSEYVGYIPPSWTPEDIAKLDEPQPWEPQYDRPARLLYQQDLPGKAKRRHNCGAWVVSKKHHLTVMGLEMDHVWPVSGSQCGLRSHLECADAAARDKAAKWACLAGLLTNYLTYVEVRHAPDATVEVIGRQAHDLRQIGTDARLGDIVNTGYRDGYLTRALYLGWMDEPTRERLRDQMARRGGHVVSLEIRTAATFELTLWDVLKPELPATEKGRAQFEKFFDGHRTLRTNQIVGRYLAVDRVKRISTANPSKTPKTKRIHQCPQCGMAATHTTGLLKKGDDPAKAVWYPIDPPTEGPPG